MWFEQRMLLGSRDDMKDIVKAISKIYEGRQAFASLASHAGTQFVVTSTIRSLLSLFPL